MIVGPTGTGWPAPSASDRPRWTDEQMKRAVAVSIDYGARFERHLIATGLAELDASERSAGRRAYATHRRSVRDEMEACAAASGREPWVGVGPGWRPWTRDKAAIFQGLLDSWNEPSITRQA